MTNENQKLLVEVPFSGFYNSIHEDKLSDLLSEELRDDRGEIADERILNSMHDAMNWEVARDQYAASWVTHLGMELAIDGMEFDRVESPREYNFATDRIFAYIPVEQIRRMQEEIDNAGFAYVVEKRLKVTDGFIPNYSNNLADWPADVTDWDHNQLGLLFGYWSIAGGDTIEDLEMGFVDDGSEWGLFLDAMVDHSPGLQELLDQAYTARNRANCREVDMHGLGCYVVSEGTLRPQDIIPRCLAVLKHHEHWMAWSLQCDFENIIRKADADSDDALFALAADISEYMADIAPQGYEYGTHEGDGACLGFFPVYLESV